MIRNITIRHFKSYEEISGLQLAPSLNVVVGGNGQGKSNLIRALLFVFSDRMTFNQTEFSNTAHNGTTTDLKNTIEVTVEIDVAKINPSLSINDKLVLSRKWMQGEGEEFSINGKRVQKTQMASAVECIGICYSNPYNIVQQGKISSVAMMDDHDLYVLLQESTGIRRYLKKREQGLLNLEKVSVERKNALGYLAKIMQTLSLIETRKKDYQLVEKGNAYKKRELVSECSNQIVELELMAKENRVLCRKQKRDAAQAANKRRELVQEGEAIQSNISVLTEKLQIYRAEQVILPRVMNDTEVDLKDVSLKNLIQRRQELERKTEVAKREFEGEKTKFASLKLIYQNARIDSSLESSNERQKLIEKSIQQYNQEIQVLRQSISSYEKSLSRTQSLLLSARSSNPRKVIDSVKQTHSETLKNHKAAQSNLQANKLEKVLTNRRKNEILIEIHSAQQSLNREQAKFNSRTSHLINFSLLEQLRLRNIEGVYGYAIEYIEVNPDVAFAYDMAIKNKFFSLLVENDSVAMKVIAINKELKGRQVNIYTLSHIRDEAEEVKKYPDPKDAFPLLNPEWIRIQNPPTSPRDFVRCLEKLINKTVANYVLVEEFSQALQISKVYHLNCITGSGQVVFSDAVICRVGETAQTSTSKLLTYSKLMGMRKALRMLEREQMAIVKRTDELENRDSQLTADFKKAEVEFRRSEGRLKEGEIAFKTSQSVLKDEAKMKELISEARRQMERKEQQKIRLQEKRTSPSSVPKEDLKKSERDFKSSSKLLTEMVHVMSTYQNELNTVTEGIKALEKSLEDNAAKDEESKFMESIADTEAVKTINQQIQSSNGLLEQNIIQVSELEEHLRTIEQEAGRYDERLIRLQETVDDLKRKKHKLEADLREVGEEELSEASISTQENVMLYTARDKWLFAKYGELREHAQDYQSKLEYIDQSEKSLHLYVKECDEEMQKSIEQTVVLFEDQFKEILSRVEPAASCTVRIKKLNQRNHNAKLKNGLDIRVGFRSEKEAQNLERKLSDLSGGQKTLISIVFLMALHKCGPSPFYAFDEADAALDINYATKICQLISQLSQNAQYIVTTFKPFLINLNADNPNAQFLEVSAKSGISYVSVVDADKALERLDKADAKKEGTEGLENQMQMIQIN